MGDPLIVPSDAFVLVLASFGSDGATLTQIVENSGMRARLCADSIALCNAFDEDVAAILVTEESLSDAAGQIRACLDAQPLWSDVPVIILSSVRAKSGTPARWRYFRQFGNVTVLNRPMSAETLVIALEAACRARAWQYVVRDQMRRLESHNADLEHEVRERTRAWQDEAEVRRRIESALNEARRMEAVGRLAGGVAHDFNNLLQVISGACQLLPYAKQDATRTESLLGTIMRAAERGSKLTQQMLAFGRRQVLSSDALDVVRLLTEMKELLRHSLREKITLELRLQDGLWHARADATQLEVALLNLTVNAKDAMPAGGAVTIAAANVSLPAPQFSGFSEVGDLEGDFVLLSATDDGLGMPPDIAAQAFDPFFTTKPIGQGSGLGLSQVYGFANQSGGAAWLQSGAHGTTVSLLLPRGTSAGVAERGEQSAAPDAGERLHGLRVLCVEDDDAVGEVAVSLLRSFGCSVELARSADEALRSDLRDFDLVFSDVRMPGTMDGIGLAHEIEKCRPGLPVLLASGYVVSPERLRNLHAKVLAKPYDAQALRRALLDRLE